MKRIDLLAVLGTLEAAETEFEQLLYDKEWFVTDVTDQITDAKERIAEELNSNDDRHTES